jgi:DNA-binding beta-propeller fold protein YncE
MNTVFSDFSARHLMLVVNKHLPGVTIYDAETHETVGSTTMEISPHEAAFSSDGQYAYVPIYGSSGVGKPGTDEHTLHFLRASDCTVISSLDTEQYKRPHSIVVGQQSGLIYMTTEVAESVVIVDPDRKRIIGSVQTGSNTSHMVAVTRDESTAYVSNVQAKTVSVLDLRHRKLADTIRTDGENQRMTLSPDERWFVTNLGPAKGIAFYRTSDHKLDFTVPVDGTPFVSKFSADGKFLYTAGFAGKGRNAAWKIDVAQRTVTTALSNGLGGDVGALEVNPFDGSVYVSDQATDAIYAIDPETWKAQKILSTAKSPDAMAFVAVR